MHYSITITSVLQYL